MIFMISMEQDSFYSLPVDRIIEILLPSSKAMLASIPYNHPEKTRFQ